MPRCSSLLAVSVRESERKDQQDESLYAPTDLFAGERDSGGAVCFKDSGPVYGIVHAAGPGPNDCTDINNPRMYFSWINKVEDSLDVEVMLAP